MPEFALDGVLYVGCSQSALLRPNASDRTWYRLSVANGALSNVFSVNAHSLAEEASTLWHNIQEMTGDAVTPLSEDPALGSVGQNNYGSVFANPTSSDEDTTITLDLVTLGAGARFTCAELVARIQDNTRLNVVKLEQVSEDDVTGANRVANNASANSAAGAAKKESDAQWKVYASIAAVVALAFAGAYVVRTFKP